MLNLRKLFWAKWMAVGFLLGVVVTSCSCALLKGEEHVPDMGVIQSLQKLDTDTAVLLGRVRTALAHRCEAEANICVQAKSEQCPGLRYCEGIREQVKIVSRVIVEQMNIALRLSQLGDGKLASEVISKLNQAFEFLHQLDSFLEQQPVPRAPEPKPSFWAMSI